MNMVGQQLDDGGTAIGSARRKRRTWKARRPMLTILAIATEVEM